MMVGLDAYFDQWLEKDTIPCLTAALYQDDREVYRYAKGLTQDGGKPITDRTQFNIGSVSKTITAALIIKLVEMGRLSLGDKVKEYIDEYRNESVTLLHLLTHTGGYTQLPGMSWPHKGDIGSFLKRLYEIEPNEAPWQSSSYFTFGYTILMDVLQRITGQKIEQFARNYLFDPLGMSDTTYDMDIFESGRYVLPCKLDSSKWDENLYGLEATGDSGIYSTAGDLLKFAEIFLKKGKFNGRNIFEEATINFMLREITGNKFAKTPVFWLKTESDNYGCFGELNSPSAVGHPGFSGCMLFIDPLYRKAGAIVTNSQQLHGNFLNYGKMINVFMGAVHMI